MAYSLAGRRWRRLWLSGKRCGCTLTIAQLRAKYEATAETPAARAVAGLIVLTGLYLAVSPWVVGFHRLSSLTGNDLIVGLALAVLGLGSPSPTGARTASPGSHP